MLLNHKGQEVIVNQPHFHSKEQRREWCIDTLKPLREVHTYPNHKGAVGFRIQDRAYLGAQA